MRLKSFGSVNRVLALFEEGEEVPPFISYKHKTFRRIGNARLRPTERKLYSEAHIYGK